MEEEENWMWTWHLQKKEPYDVETGKTGDTLEKCVLLLWVIVSTSCKCQKFWT